MPNENQEPQIGAAQPEPQPGEGHSRRLTVIGIGASAGGLRALQSFLRALPADTGLTFVVVHLSAEHESRLAELLQPHTAMPVQQVTERVAMLPDQVYIIPPGKRLLVADAHLELADFEQTQGPRLQIDLFFRSLAEQHGDGAAVILSGLGSDGAAGIQAIKEHGGLVLAQAPEEAEYDSMPRSAIATGLVDVVAPVAALAEQLVAAKQVQIRLHIPPGGDDLSDTAQQTLIQILAHLRMRMGHDFSSYKRSTLLRRIMRRMQLVHLDTLTAYLHYLRQQSDEGPALFRDLLITVTEFFRDPAAWRVLAETVMPRLFAEKGADDQVRVWTVGCATGEEAYSLAMLLLEQAALLKAAPHIQVFASDLVPESLESARQGLYPEAIATTVSEQRLRHFFVKNNSHYQVRPEVREHVLFTRHNLLQDPPFSRLDLIVCRNLLIYLEREMQERIFEAFHYALRPDGYLFLGSAEVPEGTSDLFEPLDKHYRIYQRRTHSNGRLILPSLPLMLHPVPAEGAEIGSGRGSRPAPGEAHHRMLEEIAPPSLLVDETYTVRHLSPTAGRYLLLPSGLPTLEVHRLVRAELQADLRLALYQAFSEQKSTLTKPVPVQFNGAPHAVSLLVRPSARQGLVLVCFLEDDTPSVAQLAAQSGPAVPDASLQQVEAELRQSREQLHTMREEYESTVEELIAANEELQSTNEEYKSTLEELETSKEELQSMNEELQTINQELKHKVDEVSQAHGDLQNLLSATEIATLFLDRELQIKRYTPPAAALFNLMPGDRNRPIAHLRSNLHYEQLEADARRILATLAPVAREVQSSAGRWFQVDLRPYRTLEDRIDGVVITFVDITEQKATQQELQRTQEYADSIVQTVRESLLVLTPDLHVQSANQSFYTVFQVTPAQTEGQKIYDLGNGQWNIPALRQLLEGVLPENQVFNDFELTHEFEHIGRHTMLLNARRLDHVQLILLAIEDITARKQGEEAVAADLAATQLLRDLGARLVAAHEPQVLYDELLAAAVVLTQADAGTLQLLDAPTHELVLLATQGFDPSMTDHFRRVDASSNTSCGIALASGERTFVDFDAPGRDDADGSRHLHVAAGYLSAQSTPLTTRAGRPLGMVSTHWRTHRRPSERQLRFLDLLARQAADLIERKEVDGALHELNKTLERRVAERTAELVRSNHELDQFAHVAAHDLKQPLRGIQHLAAWVLEDTPGGLPSSSQAHLVKLQALIQRMEKLLDDLFVYAQAGRQQHPLERVEIAALVQNVVALLDPPPGFTVTLVEPMPVVATERVPLETVLRNLIGNAVKHHPNPATGQVTIAAQLQQGWLEFAVTDNGAGIDPSLHSAMFEIFRTLAAPTRGSSGVGLTLVKKLVESRGGTVAVSSAVGVGATFRFTWPSASALAAVDA